MKSMTVAQKFSAACAALVLFTVALGAVVIYQVGGIQTNLQSIVVVLAARRCAGRRARFGDLGTPGRRLETYRQLRQGRQGQG